MIHYLLHNFSIIAIPRALDVIKSMLRIVIDKVTYNELERSQYDQYFIAEHSKAIASNPVQHMELIDDVSKPPGTLTMPCKVAQHIFYACIYTRYLLSMRCFFYLNNKKFIDEVEVAVYDTDFRMLYHDALQNDIIKETPEMIERILQKKEIDFYIEDYQGVGIIYTFEGKDYIVTAAAYDGYGYAKREILKETLALLLFSGLTVLIIVGYLLARSALAPIRSIVKEAENITASRINKRLPVKNEKDELGELSLTFNALLDRLEKSFNSQKMFVSNVSHELRTPMAALSAELDLAVQKERSPEQYQNAIHNALQDSQRVIKLIDGLLNLAKADYEPEQIKREEIRLDELLLDARELVLRAHPDFHVELVFEQEAEDDKVLTVIGNT